MPLSAVQIPSYLFNPSSFSLSHTHTNCIVGSASPLNLLLLDSNQDAVSIESRSQVSPALGFVSDYEAPLLEVGVSAGGNSKMVGDSIPLTPNTKLFKELDRLWHNSTVTAAQNSHHFSLSASYDASSRSSNSSLRVMGASAEYTGGTWNAIAADDSKSRSSRSHSQSPASSVEFSFVPPVQVPPNSQSTSTPPLQVCTGFSAFSELMLLTLCHVLLDV